MEQQPASSPPPSLPLDPSTFSLRRFILPGLFVLALFAVVFWRRPAKPSSSDWVFRGAIFGTTYLVKTRIPAKLALSKAKMKDAIQVALQRVDLQMSTYKKESELSRLNRTDGKAPMVVSPALVTVVQEAKRITALTGGAFDITIGPIVNLWGFGPKKYLNQPTPSQIAAAKVHVGIDKLALNTAKRTLQKKHPALYVDLSAIAKGYAVDEVGRTLEKAGLFHYMVEIGGEIRARGFKADKRAWKIGIERPVEGRREIFQVVDLRDISMATSGNYRNYLMVGGKRVSHLIDARTSNPVGHALSSVSVLHKDCMTADALATALYILGPDEGFTLAEAQKWAVLFLVPKGATFVAKVTTEFQARLQSKGKRPSTQPTTQPTKGR